MTTPEVVPTTAPATGVHEIAVDGWHRRASVIGMALTIFSAAPSARGDVPRADSATAQALFDEARKLITAGKYGDACPKLEESQRIDPGSGTLLNLADCYERDGRIATAWAKFLEAAAAAKAANHAERENVARDRAAALHPRLSSLVIRVIAPEKTPGLEIRRDGAIVGKAQWGSPIPTDPGEHHITAVAPTRQPWQTDVAVETGGRTVTVSVPELTPDGAAAAPTPGTTAKIGATKAPDSGSAKEADTQGLGAQRTWALATAAIGVGGIIVGSVFGLQSLSKHNDVVARCPTGTACQDPNDAALKNEAITAGNIATGAFILGGAGLAAGTILWFTAGSTSKSSTTARVGIGPGSVVLQGTWQ